MLKAESSALILLMTVPVFKLLCRTNDDCHKSNCIKTFDTFESQITVFGNLFLDKNYSHE